MNKSTVMQVMKTKAKKHRKNQKTTYHVAVVPAYEQGWQTACWI